MLRKSVLVVGVVLVGGLVACAAEDTSSTAQAIGGGGGCPSWGCGENSPIIGPYNFHELNVNGIANSANVRVLNFQIGAKLYNPQVQGAQLIAVDPQGGPTITGVGLTGGWFNLWTGTGIYKMYVSKVNQLVTYWVGPQSIIETYELNYTGPAVTHGVVCENPPGRDAGEGPGHVWKAPLEAILFTGDRYDADYKTVTASSYRGSSGWFNIACAGSALAKLHLNRHTTAGTTFGYQTTWQQRQTLLKMYVSDVCGTGTAWTYAGTPLHWQNTMGWTNLAGNEFSFEARWTENGATCLDLHRLGDLFQNTTNIYGECWRPACNGNVAAPAFNGAYIVTAVPFDPN